ncbi:hypothetical protein [Streptomyces sp. NPDC020607]|uniref:hypothetical protein n=1 Tax=Streptomyces sp. NPDC020607 TaxID=3365082 RepID=UPI00378C6F26
MLAQDRGWAGEFRCAVGAGVVLCGALVLLDWRAGYVSGVRVGLWGVLGCLLFAVLLPPRVRAGEGWMSSRRLFRTRRVCTDSLIAVRIWDGVGQRIVLRDEQGRRLVLDPRVLTANPLLWRLLERGARHSHESGSLLCGAKALEQLALRIDGETGRGVFTTSGLR